MSKSLIQVINTSTQNVTAGSVIGLGTVLRRYGCNCRLIGNSIEAGGEGYYEIDATVTVEPTAAGNVIVAVYNNGTRIQGAIATGTVATAEDPITLPLVTTVRQNCCCDSPDNLTLVLEEGAGAVTNVSLRVEKS